MDQLWSCLLSSDGAVIVVCPPQSPGALESTAVTAVYTRPGQYLYQVSEGTPH